MSTDAASTSAWRTDGISADYLARARGLVPLIASASDQAEQERRLPASVLAGLFDAGLFRLLLPRSLNGAEIDPLTFAAVMETIARADASTAWCLCQAAGCSMIAAYLDPGAAQAIFGSDARAVLAWGPGPGARAVAVDGGFRVSGRWEFASGIRHATWLGGYCPIYEPDGAPRRGPDGIHVGRTMLFTAACATIHDVWDVIGLRATASDTFTVNDLFVSAPYAAARDDEAARRHAGPLYCFPIVTLYAAGFAGVALGIARSMLDAFVTLARDKTPRGSRHRLNESGVVQSQVAQNEARLRSARLFLMSSLDEIWRAAGRQASLTLEQRITIRLAATHAIQEARAVAEACITRPAPAPFSRTRLSSGVSATSTPSPSSSRAARRTTRTWAASSWGSNRIRRSCDGWRQRWPRRGRPRD